MKQTIMQKIEQAKARTDGVMTPSDGTRNCISTRDQDHFVGKPGAAILDRKNPMMDQKANSTSDIAHELAEQLRPIHEALARLRPIFDAATSSGLLPRLFDVDAAAAYMGRTPQAMRLMIHHGKVPVTKIDGKVQLDRLALDKLIADATFYESN